MLIIYPSNKLEDLVQLLNAVIQKQREKVLQEDIIIVDNPGMQHWLSLQFAALQNIAMNIKFQKPAAYIWEISQHLRTQDQSKHDFPFKREVMSWCLDQLLNDEAFKNLADAADVTNYWEGNSKKPDVVKRFQLAYRLADMFEQYLIYRPQWFIDDAKEFKKQSLWQAWLWQKLRENFSAYEDPVEIQQALINKLKKMKTKRLRPIYIFAINSLAPEILKIYTILAQYTDVHLFHLNPCIEYWGDLKTDKAMAREIHKNKLKKWIESEDISNPLLANLGQQGKEFFNILQEQDALQIEAFDTFNEINDISENTDKKATLLDKIQGDILNLQDKRLSPEKFIDDSISFHSCHSALREIQVLHDYLLSQFNNNAQLSPRDILVMCPAIEKYAPYISAVFRDSYDDNGFDRSNPRLPCSIADRSLKDSEPLIHNFLDLIDLPDSRFEVSKILDYLRLPAIQKKFGFDDTELEIIQWWLKEACIHWGLNEQHKSAFIPGQTSTAMFSWEWGLKRLLLGFARGDSEKIVNTIVLMPHIEGQSSILLGRLMQLLENMQSYASRLKTKRTAEQWQNLLYELCEDFYEFGFDDNNAIPLIFKVINDFSDQTSLAAYEDKIELSVLRHYLLQNFSQTETNRNFLTGQITFCSMIPMRSIPFKIIAILGLNDGEFPRQAPVMGFDLISPENRKMGDRSRRLDDRYLFLEALISAREKLYLSYQGRDIQKNSEKQPSLIVKEFMEYLHKGYQWNFSNDTDMQESQLIQHPLHPFSKANFQGEQASFDQRWLTLSKKRDARDNTDIFVDNPLAGDEPVSTDDLIRFYNDPLEVFAQQNLGLFLTQDEHLADDSEPFESNALTDYMIRKEFCEQLIKDKDPEEVKRCFQLNGQLPDSPLTDILLDNSQTTARGLTELVNSYGKIEHEVIILEIAGIRIKTRLPWTEQGKQLLLWRPASAKPKDALNLWIQHLLATIYTQSDQIQSLGLFGQMDFKLYSINPVDINTAEKHLQCLINNWLQGMQKPNLLYARLGEALFNVKGKPASMETENGFTEHQKLWLRTMKTDFKPDYVRDTFISKPYFDWFYPEIPEFTAQLQEQLSAIYQPLYSHFRELKQV